MPVGALVGGIASIGGSLIGNAASSGDRDAAAQAQADAANQIKNVNVPAVDQMKIALQKYQSAGTLTPEMENTINQGASQMQGISTDPRLKVAQMNALQSLQKQGSGGLTAKDMEALDQSRRSISQDENSREQSILQDMQQRGVGGAGAELAAKLSSSQGAADRGSQQSDSLNAMAQQNALQAIANAGNLAGSQQGQDFSQQSQIAQAQDAISRFNAANQQNIEGTNVGARNQAQLANLSNAQALSNQNTGVANQQEQYNKGLYQQNFNNQMQKAQGVAGADNQHAQQLNANANATSGMWSGIGQGVNSAIGSGMQYNATQNLMDRLYPKAPAASAPVVGGSGNPVGSATQPKMAAF